MKRVAYAAVPLFFSLLAASAAVPWAWSYAGSDYVSRSRLISSDPDAVVTRRHAITWTRGAIRLTASEQTVYPRGQSVSPAPADLPAYWGRGRLGAGHTGWEDLPLRSVWNRLGFHAYEDGSSASFYDERIRGIAFPAWLPVALFGVPPLAWVARLMKRRSRREAGLCTRCGYDLRASPGGCPECGELAPAVNLAESAT